MVLIVLCRDSAEQFAEFSQYVADIVLAELLQSFCSNVADSSVQR